MPPQHFQRIATILQQQMRGVGEILQVITLMLPRPTKFDLHDL